jgi:hypothetical protein
MTLPTPIKMHPPLPIKPAKPTIQSSWGTAFGQPPFVIRREGGLRRLDLEIELGAAQVRGKLGDGVGRVHAREVGLG